MKPTTIFRHAFGVYPSLAMLAGMQLDVFTPLKDGPMTEEALAQALNVQPRKLRPLLYALINAELLSLDGDRFSNTQEAHVYLVRGRSAYLGNAHELYSDLWSATLQAGRSIRANAPQVKHDFELMSDKELAASFRGLHAGALATGRQLSTAFGFDALQSLLDVGGGSGGVAIAACQSCSNCDNHRAASCRPDYPVFREGGRAREPREGTSRQHFGAITGSPLPCCSPAQSGPGAGP
jgi:hypothetical protein